MTTVPYIISEFNKEQVKPIQDIINNIQLNNKNKVNNRLIGQIKHEYDLMIYPEVIKYLTELYLPLLKVHQESIDYLNSIRLLSKPTSLELSSAWVNFQSKHEFNPPHIHDGVFSFVLWIDIPYDIKDEINNESSKDSNFPCAGNVGFIYPSISALEKLKVDWLPVDKSWNLKTALFPSSLMHCVNPFYTSDNYRISISGNFMFSI